jgi:hypothetical protein
MSDGRSLKNRNNERQKTGELICFGKKHDPLETIRRPGKKNRGNSPGLSKYAKVLTCSFVRDTETAVSVETTGADKP